MPDALRLQNINGCATDKRRASRFYKRRLTIEECAFHQNFIIPAAWHEVPKDFPGPPHVWRKNLYEAIGNGVSPVMSYAFGIMYNYR